MATSPTDTPQTHAAEYTEADTDTLRRTDEHIRAYKHTADRWFTGTSNASISLCGQRSQSIHTR